MGDLISMADFKRQAHKSSNTAVNDVLRQIDELMAASIQLYRGMPSLPTVTQREGAVVKSMAKREEADKLAHTIGYQIYSDLTVRKGWRLVSLERK